MKKIKKDNRLRAIPMNITVDFLDDWVGASQRWEYHFKEMVKARKDMEKAHDKPSPWGDYV